jgi:tetrahydromethanopterin S-methyltransferase subunit G
MTNDIESSSLPAHVSLCQERYRALVHRMESIEHRIDKVEILAKEIHQKIDSITNHGDAKWNAAQVAVIGILLSISGFLAARMIG